VVPESETGQLGRCGIDLWAFRYSLLVVEELFVLLYPKARKLPFQLDKAEPFLPNVLSLMRRLAFDRLTIQYVLRELK
jgi:hypothetical protein